jgi:hypothetical protein
MLAEKFWRFHPGLFPKYKNLKENIKFSIPFVFVPDHDGGRPMEVNACILITHMVYL